MLLDDLQHQWCLQNRHKKHPNVDSFYLKCNTGNHYPEFSDGSSCNQMTSTQHMHALVSVCVFLCACQWDGFMTVSSHMANHVEQWAQRHGRESGELWSGLENWILLNMDAVFWKDVNLAGSLQPTPQQTDVREHTGNCIIPHGSFMCIYSTFLTQSLLVIPFVCILGVAIKSHPVSLTRVDTDTPSWQFNRLST